MEIPPRIQIYASLKDIQDFRILHFKDIKHAKEAPSHFYIAFPARDDVSLIICIITSQKESRESYYKRVNAKAIKSLVFVDKDTFSFLAKRSVIDCNQAELITKEELKNRIDIDFPYKKKNKIVPPNLKKDIKSAIIQSPLISPIIKNMIL